MAVLGHERELLVRAYEALVAQREPPIYQVWTLAEKALNLVGDAEAEVERLRELVNEAREFARICIPICGDDARRWLMREAKEIEHG